MAPEPTAHAVQTPITDGVRIVNFFNGRLLTAEDLLREQQAGQALRERLGQAVGDGVVTGLRVGRPPAPAVPDPAHPMVRISAGIAVNRHGAALRLPVDIDLSLARQPGSAPSTGAVGSTASSSAAPSTTGVSGSLCGSTAVPGGFRPCSGLPAGSPLIAAGVYLLTVAPASQAVGRAQASGLGNELVACGTDADAEGVSFRIVRVTVPASLITHPQARNRLAHLMFGTDDDVRRRAELDPFGLPAGPYGLLDQLRAITLVDEEVPLACLLWIPGQGIRFIDEWCVRRAVARAGHESDWPDLTGGRAVTEGQARFQQFQRQLADLAGGSAGPAMSIRARDVFHRLPPAGLVPLATASFPRGFSLVRFFDGMVTRPGTVKADPLFADGAKVPNAVTASFRSAPIDPESREFVWVYLVRQNAQHTPQVQPVVLFTTGFLPGLAAGQYDLSRFDVSNYVLSTGVIAEESP